MRITLVSSCGLVLEAEGRTLLVDALNKQFRCYYGLPPETFAQMLAGELPYDALCGILCTHAHPDHYNALRTRQLQAASGAPSRRRRPSWRCSSARSALNTTSLRIRPCRGGMRSRTVCISSQPRVSASM